MILLSIVFLLKINFYAFALEESTTWTGQTNWLKFVFCRNLVTSKKDAQKVNCNRNEDFERNVSPPETCKQDLDCPETGKDHASHPIQAAKHEVVNNILYEGTIKKTVKNEIYHTFDSK